MDKKLKMSKDILKEAGNIGTSSLFEPDSNYVPTSTVGKGDSEAIENHFRQFPGDLFRFLDQNPDIKDQINEISRRAKGHNNHFLFHEDLNTNDVEDISRPHSRAAEKSIFHNLDDNIGENEDVWSGNSFGQRYVTDEWSHLGHQRNRHSKGPGGVMEYNGEGFHAAEDGKIWLRQLFAASRQFGWMHEEVLENASISLRGSAATWLTAIEKRLQDIRDPVRRWTRFKRDFADRFIGASAADTSLTRQITGIEQRTNENVRKYADRMQSLANRLASPLPDYMLREAFVSGLKPVYRAHLINRGPKSLEHAVTMAVEFQSRYGERDPYKEPFIPFDRSVRKFEGEEFQKDESKKEVRFDKSDLEKKIMKDVRRHHDHLSAELKNLTDTIAGLGLKEGRREYYRNKPAYNEGRNIFRTREDSRNNFAVCTNQNEDEESVTSKPQQLASVTTSNIYMSDSEEEKSTDTNSTVYRVDRGKSDNVNMQTSIDTESNVIKAIPHFDIKCKIKVFELIVSSTLDTGCASSLISELMAEKMNLRSQLVPFNGGFITASGEKVKPLGYLPNLPIKVGEVIILTNVMVYPTSRWNMLLGLDILKPLDADILLSKKQLIYTHPSTRIRLSCPLVIEEVKSITEWSSCKMIDVQDDDEFEKKLQRLMKNEICVHCFESDHESSDCDLGEQRIQIDQKTRKLNIEAAKKVADSSEKLPPREWVPPSGGMVRLLTRKKFGSGSNMESNLKVNLDFPYNVIIGDQLTSDQKKQSLDMLVKCTKAFKSSSIHFGFTDLIMHMIDTADSPPIHFPPFRNSKHEEEIIQEEVEKLLTLGIIRPSMSPWSAPVVLVPKKDDRGNILPTKRFCVDFRQLNRVTKRDRFPMPLVEDMLDGIGKNKYFCIIDLKSAYWQIKMHPNSVEKTAFSTKKGHYEFLRMAMGLANAPASFSRLMNDVLRTHRKYSQPYFDDILVMGETFSDTLAHVEKVLTELIQANLLAAPEKTKLFVSRVNYLGFTITPEGIIPNPDKIAVIHKWPTPVDKKSTLSILNFGLYYKRWIQDFAHKMGPLYDVTGSRPWKWEISQEKSFQLLKNILTNPPILAVPDFSLMFVVQTDWQPGAVGAILAQRDYTGAEKKPREMVIAYASKRLSETEQKYSPMEGECYAVVWAVSKVFRQYLYGVKFMVETDHLALQWLMNDNQLHGRLGRWSIKLQAFDFHIHYRKGKYHGNVDALSRLMIPPAVSSFVKAFSSYELKDNTENISFEKLQYIKSLAKYWDAIDMTVNEKIYYRPTLFTSEYQPSSIITTPANATETLPGNTPTLPEIMSHIRDSTSAIQICHICKFPNLSKSVYTCCLCNRVVCSNCSKSENCCPKCLSCDRNVDIMCDHLTLYYLKFKMFPQGIPKLSKERARSRATSYAFLPESSKLYYLKGKNREYLREVPIISERREIVRSIHKLSHSGMTKTKHLLSQYYYWNNMMVMVKEIIQECLECQREQIKLSQKLPLRPTPMPKGPFHLVAIDLMKMPRSENGNIYLICAQDWFSKWPEIRTVADRTAFTVSKFIREEIIIRHGAPVEILTDGGKEFLKECQDILKSYAIKHRTTSSYNPQANGLVERFNRTLLTSIAKMTERENVEKWEDYLPNILLTYRATPHSSTGKSPFEMIPGQRMRIMGNSDSVVEQKVQDDGVTQIVDRLEVIHEEARRQVSKAQSKQICDFSQANDIRQVLTCNVGDTVFLADRRTRRGKLSKLLKGPFLVVEYDYEEPEIVLLQDSDKILRVAIQEIVRVETREELNGSSSSQQEKSTSDESSEEEASTTEGEQILQEGKFKLMENLAAARRRKSRSLSEL